MPLYRPTELHEFLSSLQRGAKRTLSQNFLIDGNVVHNIVEKIGIAPPATVVEIGPGPGVVTEALLALGYFVIAIEIDTDFAHALGRLDPSGEKLRTLEADVLHTSLEPYHLDPCKTAVVSNIPYHITTPILHWLCKERKFFSRAILMMQQEVVDKLIQQQDVSCTQVELALFFDMKKECTVSRHCFTPVPKVGSEVLSFSTKTDLSITENQLDILLSLAHTCFTHRRKTVFSVLSSSYDREVLSQFFRNAGIPLDIRPERLSVDGWIALSQALMGKKASVLYYGAAKK